ncbi:DUF2252 domain-containing protein [Cellulomonas sp. JH27-2]|uniref:DUF2252 domain-containing protein n=1 Tax=Cellulomonas sp. JH27-2 TaxID=2774139 RepID=UPI001780CE58|nr:DUF2252 domain-containing protein [Cellulomonas sp. JH27-2]MBD8058866.1 DUF2252 domain-containing protein [Cellulomonas sp. JH27-2]
MDAGTGGVDADVAHADVATRVARGRQARRTVPRAALGAWKPGPERADPAALLRAQEVTRVPDLVALRHERMLPSPFVFYRGAAVIMAADLGAAPSTGLWVQACGDAHLSNFGGFGTPERVLVFDLNDFDETARAPFEWDVKRLAASFEIAGRSLALSDAKRAAVRLRVGRAYREAMADFARTTNLGIWYARLDAAQVLEQLRAVAPRRVAAAARAQDRARSRDNLKALHKLTEVVDGERRLRHDPPVLVPVRDLAPGREHEELLDWLRAQVRRYHASLPDDRALLLGRYRLVDAARKVVGVGSVGTRCWVLLLVGRDDDDPLFLQVKEAQSSVLEAATGPSAYPNHGQRVVQGQRLVQAASDIWLGWVRSTGLDGVERDFYVRQLWDWKLSIDVDSLDATTLGLYAQLCGWTLARAHAVSGDPVAIAAYLGTSRRFETAIAEFSMAYADQNEQDYEGVRALAARGAF